MWDEARRQLTLDLGGSWRLGLASSSNRELIDLTLELAGLDQFEITVSSEEVARAPVLISRDLSLPAF